MNHSQRLFVLGSLMLPLYTAVASGDQELLIATQPASMKEDDNRPANVHAVEVMRCLLESTGRSYRLVTMPWGRAKKELSRGNLDVIFLTGLDELAPGIASDPIYLEKWYSYSRSPMTFDKEHYRVGVIRGSNIEKWLIEQGVEPDIQAVSEEQLLSQLMADRFDYFIADTEVASDELNSINLHQSFIKYVAQTATVSIQFDRQDPSFLTRFNHAISICNPNVTRLNTAESARIISYVSDVLMPQFTPKRLATIESFMQSKAYLSQAQIERRDALWQQQAHASAEHHELVSNVQSNQVSLIAQEIKKRFPMVSELFVTDMQGVLIGMAEKTTDYFQGDEPIVEQLSDMPFYLSGIRFDESSRTFQVKYSQRINITAERSPELDVIVVFGIRLENLLLGQWH